MNSLNYDWEWTFWGYKSTQNILDVWEIQIKQWYNLLCNFLIVLFLFRFICFILHVWSFYLHLCMFTTCVLGACGGQERVSDALELQLQTVLTHHVGTANCTLVVCKSISDLKCCVISPAPRVCGFCGMMCKHGLEVRSWVLSTHLYQPTYVLSAYLCVILL